MLDELQRLAETGERAGLPMGPDAVRRRAHGRQVRRRVLAGGAAAAVIALVAGLAVTQSGGRSQRVEVGNQTPTTVSAPPPNGVAITDHGALSSLSFVDGARLGFALDGPWLARTEDGGHTWYRIGGPHLNGLTSVRFASAFVGYAWVDGELLWTGDGGMTWRGVDVPDQVFDLRTDGNTTQVLTGCTDGSCTEALWSLTRGTASLINNIDFRGTTGSITLNLSRGAPTYVFSSNGRAASLFWVDSQPGNVATLPDPCPADAGFQQLAFATPASAWVACPGAIFHSSDARHWQPAGNASPDHLSGLVATFQNHACVSDQAGVSCTTDEGRTWKLRVTSTANGPVEISGITGTPVAWAIAGHALWFSTDTVTWTRL